jgi:hypothetical protein
VDRLVAFAAEAGRPTPELIGSVMVAVDGDPTVPSPDELTRRLSDPDGIYAIPADQIQKMLVNGPPQAVAARLDEWRRLGARRVVVSIVAGDWQRQVELLRTALDG